MSDKKKPGQGGRKQKGKAATSNKPDVPQVAVAQAAPDASNNNASVNVNQKDGAATSPDTSKNMTEKLEDVADSKEGSEVRFLCSVLFRRFLWVLCVRSLPKNRVSSRSRLANIHNSSRIWFRRKVVTVSVFFVESQRFCFFSFRSFNYPLARQRQ